ncbi:Aste57867_25228 [Aphanomyces stellatus]|uniref:Aste57867_25228 protein n=1 Tax=Aphanomyces stellatus TaxID=120398 RepID=A0A485LTI9_9STRA|nr:hypothetical protein As57867_025150 [Aphanomyces stellatus]VFU01855.1 Aste57867_25228 [Aphanomyces stellatus]
MDITADFRKAAKWKVASGKTDAPIHDATSEFLQSALDILQNIQKIAAIRAEKRRQYLDPVHFLPSKAAPFSDMEREELEESLLDSYKLCEQRVDELKSMGGTPNDVQQRTKVYSEIILYLTEACLRSFSLGVDFVLAHQARHDVHQGRPKETHQSPLFPVQEVVDCFNSLSYSSFLVDLTLPKKPPPPTPTPTPPVAAATTVTPTTNRGEPPRSSHAMNDDDDDGGGMDLTDDEAAQFKVENVQLHHHLHEEIDAARRVEKQVHEIQGMMHQFADKVGEQTEIMEEIAKDADVAMTNVGQGNVSLKKAADYGDGSGFTIFCIYVGASLLLLFFHYY